MIKVTTLDKREIILNAELIERIESVPETVITLTSGKKILVTQTAEEIMERVIAYRRQILQPVDSQDGVN
ncbi:MAG: flagellar protein FlbD [Moorella sp. (in: firmicutes)]|nr:flagellar protein FlbD [Moorella sp. (in: firmicutes)]